MAHSKHQSEKKEVSIKSGNLKLGGTVFYSRKTKNDNPAILFLHGWTGERTRSFQYAESLAKLGYISLAFDMSGHGTSEGDIGKFTPKEFLDDVLIAFDYLSKMKGVDRKNISVVGTSFGSYLAAILSKKRKIKNLVLRAPADYPNETFNKLKVGYTGKKIAIWRNKKRGADGTYALEALHAFNGNVLIIECEKDDRVPHQTIVNYMNAAKQDKLTYVLVKDAPHSIKEGKFRDEVERILIKWFSPRINRH